MSPLEYSVVLEDGSAFSGRADVLAGAVRAAVTLPEGRLRSVTAEWRFALPDGGRIFMNGYQTWTYCPEYTKADRIRGLGRLPGFLVDRFGLDRYGDYFFVPYPDRPGVTHGTSYCYFRDGERYTLVASLDEAPGYTLFEYRAEAGVLRLTRDCAGVRCGGEFHAFDLYFAEGAEAEVFDGWFAAAGIRPRTEAKLAGYSSWYNRYEKISEASILADLAGCAGVLRPGDLFQIDDGWEPAVGDWLEPDGKKFPSGMKAAADAIHARGFRAGLWLAPFVCRKGSALMREHPDWLLRHEGKPWYCGCNWGGFYSLDIENPEVAAYLERVFARVLDEWGFDLVKLDFLYGGAPFGTDTESRAAVMLRGMRLLRRLCGEKLLLACGVPLMPAFGLADYCRIGCDTGPDWDNTWLMRLTNRERVSTRHAIGNSIFRRQLNGRAFGSDPDVFFLRENNVKLTAAQKERLSTVCALFGSVLLTSDDMQGYSPRTRERYGEVLRLREAREVRVDTRAGLRVTYELDGAVRTLDLP